MGGFVGVAGGESELSVWVEASTTVLGDFFFFRVFFGFEFR